MLGIVSYVFFIGKPPTGHGETLPTHLTLEWFILGIISPIKRHYIKLNILIWTSFYGQFFYPVGEFWVNWGYRCFGQLILEAIFLIN